MSSYSRQKLEEYLKTIEVQGNVLDIGGSQNPIKGRVKSWEVEDYKILDLKNPHHGDKPDLIHDIQVVNNLLTRKLDQFCEVFDIVFCIEVSEYWIDPVKALKNINFFLKRGGILYISFHFLYPIHPPHGEDCLRYTRWGIMKLMKATGFEIEEIITREFKNKMVGVSLFNQEGMRGENKNRDPMHFDQGYIIKAIKL